MSGLDDLINEGLKEEKKDCPLCYGSKYRLEKVNGSFVKKICSCVRKTDDLYSHLEELEISTKKLSKYIPNEVYREEFDKEILLEDLDIPNQWKVPFNTYVRSLEGIQNSIQFKKPPVRSYIVIAPSNYGKKHFIYSTIKKTLEAGLKPSELLQIKDISDKLKERDNHGLYEIFYDSDIIFLSLGKQLVREDIYSLSHMMELAEINAKPLIVISKFPRNYLALLEPTILDDVGLLKTKKGYYGLLQLVGFDDDIMKADYISKANRVKPKHSHQQNPTIEKVRNENIDFLDSMDSDKDEDEQLDKDTDIQELSE